MAVGGVRPDEAAGREQRARAIALFRYQLIREAADPAHSTRQRGRMVRELAGRTHLDTAGRPVRLSRETLDRWIRAWQRGGFDALVPHPRQASRRLPAEVMDLAVALKDEAASLLPGLLAATRTGLPPASDDELTNDDQPPTWSTSTLLGAPERLIGWAGSTPSDVRQRRLGGRRRVTWRCSASWR
jgi:hypothetical protein